MAQTATSTSLPEHVQKTISEVQTKIRQQEQEILENKKAVNSLLAVYQLAPMYTELGLKPESSGGPLRGDEYFGQPLQTVVREVLVSRKSSNLGPASVAEIYSAMLGGGYQFESRDEENAKRGLRISLTKNSATFTKLPGGKYGLREWYPAIKDSKPRANQKETGTDATEETADDFDFEAKEAANAESK